MNPIITFRTESIDKIETGIRIDNTSEFKDCIISRKSPHINNGEPREILLQIHGSGNSASLEINGIGLMGQELQIVLDFINQLKTK